METRLSRRQTLTLALSALVVTQQACSEEPTDAPPNAAESLSPDGSAPIAAVDGGTSATSVVWLVPTMTFIAGSAASQDLATTLPADIVRGGTFGVDPASAALPQGMTLSAAGVLSVGGAIAGTTAGVVFTYEEP